MKTFFLAAVALLVLSSANAQTKPVSDALATKFISYFNSGKADSIYALLAEQAKQSMSVNTLNAATQQIKAALGNLIKKEFIGSDKNAENYIAIFERSGPVLYLTFNQDNKITRFFTGVDKRDLPGTITINTNSAVLKGTLSVPEVKEKVPVVLLIAGSGPTDRNGNSTLLSGKPDYFLQISNELKLKNIAVLRYDKRGVGQSTTTKAEAETNFNDFVDDAAAIIKNLKADPRFSKVIVAGHSEGSLVGIIAAAHEKVDAVISLAGPGFPLDVILKTQFKAQLPPAEYQRVVLIIDSIKAGNPVKQKLDPNLELSFRPSVQPYFHSLMAYNPRQQMAKLITPALIIQGTNDVQVSVADAEELKKAKPDAQLKLIKGMSHILKEAPADRAQNIATYRQPNLPLHPELIPVMSAFINGLK